MHMKKKRLSLIVASVLAMTMSAPVWAKVVHDGQSFIVDNDDSSESHIGGQYWFGVQPDTYGDFQKLLACRTGVSAFFRYFYEKMG